MQGQGQILSHGQRQILSHKQMQGQGQILSHDKYIEKDSCTGTEKDINFKVTEIRRNYLSRVDSVVCLIQVRQIKKSTITVKIKGLEISRSAHSPPLWTS